MARFRCNRCLPPPAGFIFEADKAQCPRCGTAHPHSVFPLADVHFVVLSPSGPIDSVFGRQHIACQPRREHMAMHEHDEFAASDDPRAVTCPSCKGTRFYQDLAKLFPELQGPPATGGITISGKGCCD